MVAIVLLRIPLVGTPSVERCSKRNFHHKGNSRVYIELTGKKSGSFSGLFQKPAIVEQQFCVLNLLEWLSRSQNSQVYKMKRN
jgi:hypothetical protein